MTLLDKIALTSAILGVIGYLFQILMIHGCCDKHINLQVNVFRATTIAFMTALISYITTLIIK